ncbi:MAG: hypothetical protein PUF80_00555 [Firmicutes bacterium]|nr:hypothetical protein [Bacillota bacterium]
MKMKDDRYQKCDHVDVIETRNADVSLHNWEKCGFRTCCSYCSFRYDCKDACSHIDKEIKKQKNNDTYSIGQRLRACRIRADVSVDNAAAALDLTTNKIIETETLAEFSVLQVSKFCDLYSCTPNDIFGFDAPPQSDAPAKWRRLHLDGTPKEGQFCQVLLYSNDPITTYGKVFCSIRAARWKNGHFMSAVNDQVPLKANLIGWLPLPEPPDGYTATLSRIDDLNGGDDHEDS